MDFLYRDRGAGKRTVKPSKDSEHLEALIVEDSDDSDFEIEKHKGKKGGNDDDDEDDNEEDDDSNSGQDSDNSQEESDDDGSSSEDDSDDSDDDEEEDEDDMMQMRKNLTTNQLMDCISKRRPLTRHGDAAAGSTAATPQKKVCGACLGTSSDDTNEIVECDGCGVSVHEGCYGIQESGSVCSNVSEASTEPWFCEPCRAGVRDPTCQVCPNVGGIYKETDVGTWIHLVCALYTPNISFFDPERITRATLFELNYTTWGRRACSLCKDVKLSRTGICVECDAGMCRQYFHPTCAQENGLLSKPREDDHDSYFGHCRMHTDSDTIKKRKRNWIMHQQQYKERQAKIQAGFGRWKQGDSSETSVGRILRKLEMQKDKWRLNSCTRPDPWVPTQKMPRSILTSSSAIRKLTREIRLQGWNAEAMEEAERNRETLQDIHKRWGVAAGLTVEYVAYYHDREKRISSLQDNLSKLLIENNQLIEDETVITTNYNSAVESNEAAKRLGAGLTQHIAKYCQLLQKLHPSGRAPSIPNSSVKTTAADPNPVKPSPVGGRSRSARVSVSAASARVINDKSPDHAPPAKASPGGSSSIIKKGAVRPKQPTPVVSATKRSSQPTATSGSVAAGGNTTPKPNVASSSLTATVISNTTDSHSPRLSQSRGGEEVTTPKQVMTATCQLCKTASDQHLLALCDVCRFHYHLGCLSPPLSRMPKKTKQYGWQCSECDKDPSEAATPEPSQIDPNKPRTTRGKSLPFSVNGAYFSDLEDISPKQTKGKKSEKRKEKNSVKSEKKSAATTKAAKRSLNQPTSGAKKGAGGVPTAERVSLSESGGQSVSSGAGNPGGGSASTANVGDPNGRVVAADNVNLVKATKAGAKSNHTEESHEANPNGSSNHHVDPTRDHHLDLKEPKGTGSAKTVNSGESRRGTSVGKTKDGHDPLPDSGTRKNNRRKRSEAFGGDESESKRVRREQLGDLEGVHVDPAVDARHGGRDAEAASRLPTNKMLNNPASIKSNIQDNGSPLLRDGRVSADLDQARREDDLNVQTPLTNHTLPPKKLFKSKAEVKELSDNLPTSTQSVNNVNGMNFQSWLDKKLGPVENGTDHVRLTGRQVDKPPLMNGVATSSPRSEDDRFGNNGLDAHMRSGPPASFSHHHNSQSLTTHSLGTGGSRQPPEPANGAGAPPPGQPLLTEDRLQPGGEVATAPHWGNGPLAGGQTGRGGPNSGHRESIDEAMIQVGHVTSGTHDLSMSMEEDEDDDEDEDISGNGTEDARTAAGRERRRQRREEKVKRREEKRRKKEQRRAQQQQQVSESTDAVLGDVGHDKPPPPIRIKIKPIPPPPPAMDVVVTETLANQSGTTPKSTAELTTPKQQQNTTSVSSGRQPRTVTTPGRYSSPVRETGSAAEKGSAAKKSGGKGRRAGDAQTAAVKGTSNPSSGAKKGRDVRTQCNICSGPGTNSNLVRCDECLGCFHFSCLIPPVKKTPKVPGWGWSCSDCAPSDEDKSWHL